MRLLGLYLYICGSRIPWLKAIHPIGALILILVARIPTVRRDDAEIVAIGCPTRVP